MIMQDIFVYLYICIFVCVYTHVYIYIYIYIYICIIIKKALPQLEFADFRKHAALLLSVAPSSLSACLARKTNSILHWGIIRSTFREPSTFPGYLHDSPHRFLRVLSAQVKMMHDNHRRRRRMMTTLDERHARLWTKHVMRAFAMQTSRKDCSSTPRLGALEAVLRTSRLSKSVSSQTPVHTPNSRIKNLEIQGFDPSWCFFLRGLIPPDKGTSERSRHIISTIIISGSGSSSSSSSSISIN